MKIPDYISVRRPSAAPFGVLPDDLPSEAPAGYDLDLMRDITTNGLDHAIRVSPVGVGQFEVIDGLKRIAAIRMLIQINKMVYDKTRGFARPAKLVFALIRCRIGPRSATPRNS
jgi:hypothetical protein